jgi:hypothetical protein
MTELVVGNRVEEIHREEVSAMCCTQRHTGDGTFPGVHFEKGAQ